MPSITTNELVERAMAAADLHDQFVTPRQWMYWASLERMALDLFIARAGWTQAFESVNITVTGSEAGEYEVGEDLMAIVAVHQLNTDGRTVRRLEQRETAAFLRGLPGSNPVGNAMEYRCKRDGDTVTLNFYPEPRAGEIYVVTYLPHPLRLTLDASPAAGYANTVAYPMGWEERIVLGMARRALDKEESDSLAIQRQMKEVSDDIERLCHDRVTGDGPSVINTDVARRGWVDRLSYPPAAGWWWA